MERFSQQLIERLIRYMHDRHGLELPEDEAKEYLRVYAEAFGAFEGSGRTAAGAHSAADEPPLT